jgi:hypothetical protein
MIYWADSPKPSNAKRRKQGRNSNACLYNLKQDIAQVIFFHILLTGSESLSPAHIGKKSI